MEHASRPRGGITRPSGVSTFAVPFVMCGSSPRVIFGHLFVGGTRLFGIGTPVH